LSTAAPEPTRSLEFADLLNARDLGGYPTTDGAQTRWRSLLRADDLSQLSELGLQALADYGVRTILDLRWPEEAARYPSPVPARLPQLRYARISLLTHAEDEWRLRSRDAAKELWKCAVLEHVRTELRHVLGFIAAAPREPLLFPEAIARDYSVSGDNLREGYLRRYADIERERILEALRCPEQGAYNMLAFLKRAGGVRAYLAQIGLSAEEIARLRVRLRD
jgi:hypothetical protein